MKRLILASNVLPVHITRKNGNYRIEKEDEQTISGLQDFYEELWPRGSRTEAIFTPWKRKPELDNGLNVGIFTLIYNTWQRCGSKQFCTGSGF